MFDEAFTKLEIDDVSVLIDDLNSQVDGSLFDPLETTILSVEPTFYPGYRFLHVADHATNPPLERFVFQKGDSGPLTVLDWNCKTIHTLNKEVPISLTDDNIYEYVRFYYAHVKGRYGRFTICETADHIQWKDEPPLEIRKAINNFVKPLHIVEKEKTKYVIEAFMLFRDGLFSTEIHVQKDGFIDIQNQKIVMEDIPVQDFVSV